MARLDGKVMIVTGAGSGIGEAVALRVGREGARVVVAAHRQESAERVVAEITAAGGTAIGAFGDVSKEEVAASIVARAIEAYGRIDVLHNNAAATTYEVMGRDVSIAEADIEIWQRTLAVNLLGPMMLSRNTIPHMIAQGGGSIIMTSSARAIEGDLGYPAYGASKAALMNLASNIATQYGRQGVRCNSLIVGFVMTKVLDSNIDQATKDLVTRHQLSPFFGQPDDIANAVVFLASDESRFVTGTSLAVDGGITAHTAPYADLVGTGAMGSAAV